MRRFFRCSATLAAILIPALAVGGAGLCQETPAGQPPAAAPAIDEPYWQQEANYSIACSLDAAAHRLTGTETIHYTNNSPDSLDVFYLHLYANAFREKASPLVRDFSLGTLHFFVGLPKSMRGWIDVANLTVNGAPVEFTVDGTILKGRFPAPLTPGGTVTITLTFDLTIMKTLGRMGYSGKQYTMAQWYPKMVVYDRNGWHPDQYRMGEFYGEFGTFDVEVTLPGDYVIAATGTPVSGDPGWKKNPVRRGGKKGGGHPVSGGGHPGGAAADSGGAGGHPGAGASASDKAEPAPPKTVKFRAEKVHDFAWAASPSFMVQDTTWNGIHVASIFNPWSRGWADSVLARELRTLAWLEKTVGTYPYDRLTIVDTPLHGGMEYPMFIANGSADESLIMHEAAHIYFYGAVANDERAEAWLDEGFAAYLTFRNAEERYGPFGEEDERGFLSKFFGRRRMWDALATPIVERQRTGYSERIATPAHEFKNGFSIMPYIKAPLVLRALRYTIGAESFDAALKTYYERWKYKHVDEEAFRSVCEELSGQQLGDFFQQWLHSTKSCDYRVDRFKVRETKDGWKADVSIARKDEILAPLTLAFRLKDGSTVTERVDGTMRTIEGSYTFPKKPLSLAINPDNEILDVYAYDNYKGRRAHVALDLPWNDYYPVDAREYRILPLGYYNDVDGGKAGLRVRTSYDDVYRRVTLQGLYGFESEKIDFYGAWDQPTNYFGRDAHLRAEGYIREGRQGVSFEITKIRRKALSSPLAQHLSFSAGYEELIDTAYVFPTLYEKGLNYWAAMTFGIYPRTDLFASAVEAGVQRSLWWSEFDYEKFSLEARLTPGYRTGIPVRPRLRFYYGSATGYPPTQEKPRLAGAGPLAKERYFWLRSVGAFPKDDVSNFRVPGDGNLRGFYDGDFGFKKLFASNIELGLPAPLPLSRKWKRMLDPEVFLFYDWGRALDERPLEGLPPTLAAELGDKAFDEILSDFGVGVRLGPIVAEFPVYASNPVLIGGTETWDFRWTVSFWSTIPAPRWMPMF